MRLRSWIRPFLLLAFAAKLAQFTVTRDGVGPLEYLAAATLVTVMLVTTFHFARAAIRRA